MPHNENISTHQKVAEVLSLVQEAASSQDLTSVQAKLSQFAQGVRDGLQSFYSTYQDPALDPALAMIGYQVMEPLTRLLQIVEDLLAGTIAPSAALEPLQGLAQELTAADVALREAELQTDLLPCYSCGHDNERTATNCTACGGELQHLPREADYVVLPDDYWILYNHCEQVAQGSTTLTEWRNQINAMAAEFTQGRQKVESANQALGADIDAAGLLKALDAALDALQEMREFERDRDPNHLNQGWMRLLDAAKDVQDKGGAFYQSLNQG